MSIQQAGIHIELASSDAAMVDDPLAEVIRSLKGVITKLEKGQVTGAIMDLNGNRMGGWSFWKEEDDEDE